MGDTSACRSLLLLDMSTLPDLLLRDWSCTCDLLRCLLQAVNGRCGATKW
jgi:hypothetical protein